MLSRDEINARAFRLSGRAPNPYTGTLNDPHQEAMSAYAGPGWAQFFGSIQKSEEDAYLDGKNFRVGWGGFGNTVSDGGGTAVARRGPSLAAMSGDPGELNPLEAQAQKEFLRQQQANLAVEQAKQEKAAQKAYNDAEAARVNQGLAKSYDDFVLSSTLGPTGTPTTITRTPGVAGPQLPGHEAAGNPTITARPTEGIAPNDLLRRTVPANLRLGVEKVLAEQELAVRKQKEVERENKANEALAANSVMSPEAVEDAAVNYNKTGVMPVLGMKDPNNRQRITNRAAELARAGGGGGADIAANKAIYKADAGSLTALQKQRDAIGAFEKTAAANIDLFLNAAGKVVDTGSPMANILARNVSGKMLGSPDQAAFDAARQVAINEIAKITTNPNLSGQLSDSARHEVDAFNPREATLAQTVAVMRLLKQDMGNRVKFLDESLKDVKGRIAQPAGGPAAPDGFVDMIAPDGGPLHVPAGQVDAMLKAGAKRKGGG